MDMHQLDDSIINIRNDIASKGSRACRRNGSIPLPDLLDVGQPIDEAKQREEQRQTIKEPGRGSQNLGQASPEKMRDDLDGRLPFPVSVLNGKRNGHAHAKQECREYQIGKSHHVFVHLGMT